jgi:hypothetical protein
MNIFSLGNYYAPVDEQPEKIKPLLQQETGQKFRRIDRFIQLALLGASRCVNSIDLPASTAVYLTSGQGDLDVTIEVLEKIYQKGEPPKPLSFINTVSNAACFNIARHLGLQGKSSFVTGHYFSFERNLELAYLDFCTGVTKTALVGSVDICAVPLAQHRERIGVAERTVLGEGSHWWLLAEECEEVDRVAQLLAVRSFNDERQLQQWLDTQDISDSWTISRGQYLLEEQLQRLQKSSKIIHRFDYCDDLAFYNTQSGSALQYFIQCGHKGILLHINADPDGRYCVYVVSTIQ